MNLTEFYYRYSAVQNELRELINQDDCDFEHDFPLAPSNEVLKDIPRLKELKKEKIKELLEYREKLWNSIENDRI